MFEMPYEPVRPGQPGRTPFTYDDLLSFHFLLEDDEWLAQMIGEPVSEPGRRRRPKRG